MADEIKTPKIKNYKIAEGEALRIPRLSMTVTNDMLLMPKIVQMLQKEAPELFAQGVVVLA